MTIYESLAIKILGKEKCDEMSMEEKLATKSHIKAILNSFYGVTHDINMLSVDEKEFIKTTLLKNKNKNKFGYIDADNPSEIHSIQILSNDRNLAMEAADCLSDSYPEGTGIDWIEVEDDQPDVVLKWIANADLIVIVPDEDGNISEKLRYDIIFAQSIKKEIKWISMNKEEDDPIVKIYKQMADQAYELEQNRRNEILNDLNNALSGGTCVVGNRKPYDEMGKCCCDDESKYLNGKR